MTNYNRILSIDILRGITLLIMIFVTNLNMSVTPAWLGNRAADFDGMGLADWVFPAFLFIIGLSIPVALSKRFSSGQSVFDISRHIFTRSLSLIIIGVLMLNIDRVDPELTGIGKNLWAILMYIGVFLFWNDYPDKENKFFTVTALKFTGLAILAILILKFKSGQLENNGSLITGWWGFAGIIGWGYLVASFVYVLCRDSILKTSIFVLFFLFLNILSTLDLLGFLNPFKPIFGVIINGNIPFVILSGLAGGLIIKKIPVIGLKKTIMLFAGIGIIYLIAGFILRKWIVISRIQATPSWALICSGICFIVFIILYWITDVKSRIKWAAYLQPAGENSLTTYLAPELLFYFIISSGIPLLFFKQSNEPIITIAGALVWAFLMIGLTAVLARLKIKLKI
jgi:heparan-alpha-glucosaminide N-acetyltransferase